MRRAGHAHRPRVPRLPLPSRGLPLGRALVPSVSDQLSRPRAEAGRPWGDGRSHPPLALGPTLRPRAGEADALPPAAVPRAMARRRDGYSGRWAMALLCRAVDGSGQTIGFLLSAKRDQEAAPGSRPALLPACAHSGVRSPGALRAMKRDGTLGRVTRHRRGRWLNPWVAQDHRRLKRWVRPRLGVKRFVTGRRTLADIPSRPSPGMTRPRP